MQSSRALRALPVVLALAAPLAAQGRYQIKADGTWLHQTAKGKRVAQVARGVTLVSAADSGEWLAVTLDGWIWGGSVGAAPATPEGYDLAVTKAGGENLRGAPKGAIVATLTRSVALKRIEENGRWIHVQRQGWVVRSAVTPVGQVASTVSADTSAPAPTPGPRPGADSTTMPTTAVSARRTDLYRAPEGPVGGALASGTPLRVLGRSGEWSRVQLEAWVKSADLAAATPGVLEGVSAAELRADPTRYVGQVVRWRVQFVALETADDLRPDIPDGLQYLLARGPAPERGFVYVIVPDAKKAAVATLAPLTDIIVTATVRTGKSRFIGNPVVDLLSFEAVQ
jgi:hypothetical protein